MPNATQRDKDRRVLDLLDQFGLIKCADTLIGFPAISKTISGGEMKRLSRVCTLFTPVSILYMLHILT